MQKYTNTPEWLKPKFCKKIQYLLDTHSRCSDSTPKQPTAHYNNSAMQCNVYRADRVAQKDLDNK